MKTSTLLIMLLFFVFSINVVYSQILIENKKDVGYIDNERGTIKLKRTGALIDLQDTILGTFIYQSKQDEREQIVPNITYSKLIFDATSRLRVDSFSNTPRAKGRPLTILDSFIVRSGDESKIRNNYIEIHNEANVRTNGHVKGRRAVAMVNQYQKQSIHGENKASFSHLRIQNPYGVDIKGNFYVTDHLDLRDGQVRNLDTNNIQIGDAKLDRSEPLSYTLADFDLPEYDLGDTT